MFKAIRIGFLLLVLLIVTVSGYLTRARSTDWQDTLYVKIYPINGDGSDTADRYIDTLDIDDFTDIESFFARETGRHGRDVRQPVKMELGARIHEQPPLVGPAPSRLDVVLWSLKLRWWSGSITSEQDRIDPDVRIFVRYHDPEASFVLENSVGLQKGMVGIVNAFGARQYAGTNNVVIAHEFLHTLGASDKYEPADSQPRFPEGYAEPERKPLYPQRQAEIMGGRIAISEDRALMPRNLDTVVIGNWTAEEIKLR